VFATFRRPLHRASGNAHALVYGNQLQLSSQTIPIHRPVFGSVPLCSLVDGPLPMTLAAEAGIQDIAAICPSPPLRNMCLGFLKANGYDNRCDLNQ